MLHREKGPHCTFDGLVMALVKLQDCCYFGSPRWPRYRLQILEEGEDRMFAQLSNQIYSDGDE